MLVNTLYNMIIEGVIIVTLLIWLLFGMTIVIPMVWYFFSEETYWDVKDFISNMRDNKLKKHEY